MVMRMSVVDLAQSLANRGKEFNEGILERFRDYFPEKELAENARKHGMEKEHLRLIECVAQTLSWLQPRVDSDVNEAIKLVKFYRRTIIEARDESDPGVWIRERVGALRTRADGATESEYPVKPSKTEGIIAGLRTWARAEFPQVEGGIPVSLRILQEKVLTRSSRVNWTAIAPMKLYALDRPELGRSWPERPDPDTGMKECYLPIGRRVSASIRALFGIDFGESEKDHRNAQQLQIRLKEWANDGEEEFSLLDINSGLQAFKSINEIGVMTYRD